ncbi:MAG: penicillin-binding protein 2 [Deltaproteobacteria bacterium]|nr:penicillin-binding protein 2 [Deltaproteobacteria bacterium]
MRANISGLPLEIEFKKKGVILLSIVILLCSVLVLKLMYMQVLRGSYYEGLSKNNRIRILSLKAPRGKILDRGGVVLADNRPAYNIIVIPEDISGPEIVYANLSEILDLDLQRIEEKIKAGLRRPFEPVYIAKDISFDQVAQIEVEMFNLPGVSIEATTERDYVYKDLASHVLGFLGEVSKKELRSYKGGDYTTGDLIGKGGIELECENILRGKKGKRVIEVDAPGRRQKILDELPPVHGADVRLTIDKDLQVVARDALGDKVGAIVAMVPATGEVLAMVSRPGFDPNMFLSPIAPEMWDQIIKDPLHPLENRALRGQYPPGSVFKIVVALAGLSTGAITPEEKIFCPGYFSLGERRFMCWKPSGHGDVDLVRAISESCDVYFYRLGKILGIDKISTYALKLGFGRPTGIELSEEVSGLIPTKAWKMARFNEAWYPGETLITAIGQGFVLVTPLQVAKVMSAVVNGGHIYTPRILMSHNPNLEGDIDISDEGLSVIKEALRKVVEDPHGTGRGIRDPMFSIGGKTGTSQVVKGVTSKLPDESDIPYKYRDHAWFFGFSPVENPEILVVAVVEHGGHGGSIAAPIVRDVIKGYFFLKGLSNEQMVKDSR